MKKYLLTQLTQISAWIGIILVISAFIAPREYICFLGIALFFTHDESIKKWVVKQAPWIADLFE